MGKLVIELRDRNNPIALAFIAKLKENGFFLKGNVVEYEDCRESALREVLDDFYKQLP